MKRFLYILFFMVTAAALSPVFGYAEEESDYAPSFLANYNATVFSTLYNNFPGDEANAVLQTSDGFLWFGGYNGLIRYDGARFTVWDAVSPNGFGSSNIRALHEDRDGVLWIGTNDSGIVAFENGEFTVYNREDGLPSNTIRAIASDSNGVIHAGTPGGVFRVNRDRTVSVPENGDMARAVIGLALDGNDNIFAVLSSGEFVVYSEDEMIIFPHSGECSATAGLSGNRAAAGFRNGDFIITGFANGGFSHGNFIGY